VGCEGWTYLNSHVSNVFQVKPTRSLSIFSVSGTSKLSLIVGHLISQSQAVNTSFQKLENKLHGWPQLYKLHQEIPRASLRVFLESWILLYTAPHSKERKSDISEPVVAS
jgi:hypothetical protein